MKLECTSCDGEVFPSTIECTACGETKGIDQYRVTLQMLLPDSERRLCKPCEDFLANPKSKKSSASQV